MAHFLSETDLKVVKVTDKFSETVHLMLNDPSMGLYRIQEHVKRSVPELVEKKIELQNLNSSLQGASYDVEYSLKTVKSIDWSPHFTIIQECLKSAIASKTNLQRLESTQKNELDHAKSSTQNSVNIEENTEQAIIEGFICPACMIAWTSQDDLISHWVEEEAGKR
ncbi:BLOC-1-related complex subunit 8 homolog isoform X2 [Xenia sp. Carnegie-2017]|uniref:BLOC-1-related complex subunit 8 homolog isoform X2 n=1 Tax=Xenia sp. Carnegie-2017 TaxID=2897299 RepID=UPI001F03D90B|nr:BLOC-1-related complex subunit 8 homolog isoform X2 [Xenia sp. Carnegie-2017]